MEIKAQTSTTLTPSLGIPAPPDHQRVQIEGPVGQPDGLLELKVCLDGLLELERKGLARGGDARRVRAKRAAAPLANERQPRACVLLQACKAVGAVAMVVGPHQHESALGVARGFLGAALLDARVPLPHEMLARRTRRQRLPRRARLDRAAVLVTPPGRVEGEHVGAARTQYL